MPRSLKVIIAIGVVLSVLSALTMMMLNQGLRKDMREAEGQAAGLADLEIVDFSLTDQNERVVTRESLRGRVTVLDFFFTHCPFVCPILVEKMGQVASDLRDTDVRFVSVSVDPAHDTPERLRKYAELHEIDTNRWSLVGGHPGAAARIARGLKFDLEDDPEQPISLEGGVTMNNVKHPSWFVLIGPDLRVRGVYYASVPEDLARLEADARALARTLP